jgi:carotenoid cleavage dioxygenase-like enzyme
MSKSQIFLKNATEFVSTKAKLISGEIPKTLNGNYFRNGPGLFNYEKNVGEHWFNGDGYILKLGFKNGECTAQGKFVQTPIYQERSSSKILMDNILQKIWRKWVYGSQSDNIANTNVLCLKDSNYFLATCEGGQPYLMKK